MIGWIVLILIFAPLTLTGLLYAMLLRLNYKNKNYWPSKGVVVQSAKLEFIKLVRTILKPKTMMEIDTSLHKDCKDSNVTFIGGHELTVPFLYVHDLEIIKHILIKDFDHFVNRRKMALESTNPLLTKMLFFLGGNEWKELRSKMSPTFTTGKIKKMFSIFDSSSKELVKFLSGQIPDSSSFDTDLSVACGKYTMDVIATSAFGIDGNIFKEQNSIFEQMGQKTRFTLSFTLIMKFFATKLFPSLMKKLGITLMNGEAIQFFENVVKSVIRERESKGIKREDFLQLMMQLKHGALGKIDESEIDIFEKEAMLNTQTIEEMKERTELNDEVIVAQSILFIMAGYDTTQSTLLFAAYQMALCPELQDKLAEEVTSTFKQVNGEFTYESVNEMQYLDKFICETLRMFPPAARTDRTCNFPYTIPGTDVTIEKDTLIYIPIYAIHHDKDIFPEPEKFDPERFSAENKANRNPYAYMPFGYGPRNCIGMRFALAEVKVALAHFVLNFIVEPCDKTLIPMKFSNDASTKPLGCSMWLKIKKRQS